MDEAYRQGVEARSHRVTVEPDLSRVRRIYARQNFYQRRLAGAVLAEQGVDLAATQIEIDRVEGERSREMFAQRNHFEQGTGRSGAARGRGKLNHACCGSSMSAGRRVAPAGVGRLFRHAPDFEIVFLVVIAWDERVLIAAFAVNVGGRHQERRLHKTARRLLVERAIEFIDRLIRL